MTQELIAHQVPFELPGGTHRRFLRLGFLALFVFVFVIGGWAVFSKIEGAIIGSGTVIVETKPKLIQHLDGGIVKFIRVKDRDRVKMGDLLMQLDATRLAATQMITKTRLFEMLARADRLAAERDGKREIKWSQTLLDLPNSLDVKRAKIGQSKLFRARRQAVFGQVRYSGIRDCAL